MITQKELKSILHYDPVTGILTWLKRLSYSIKVNDEAGCADKDGYINIGIKGKLYKAHRLAWLYMTGFFPKEDIDHINHITGDNSFKNLRAVSHAENLKNQKLHKNNISGYTGIYQSKGDKKWEVEIKVDGKTKYLGRFRNLEEAVIERKKAEVFYRFHKNHGEKATCNIQ